ncbi:hypothetical protein AB0M46_18945 [Dactylosporangium sp. NPDC051485]|uniref:hypothetical protein n=1 Tax=Dactylosporangium sp. NPDC051485 TaxID=3154846 RepID=UPI0034340042
MSEHTIVREHGRWTYGTATLRARGTMRRALLHTDAGDFELAPADRRRLGVVARTGDRPVVALQMSGARVPGPGPQARWSMGRHTATLTRGTDRIEVRCGWRGTRLRVEVTGDWAEPELVVLTACFAVLSRRRQRMLTAMAIAAATSPGG